MPAPQQPATGAGIAIAPPDPLLPAVAAGDRGAMESCLDLHEGLVWALARRMLGPSPDAEDAVQEIFIEVWRSAHRFNPAAGSEAAFIATIARRRLIDARRRLGRIPTPTQPAEEDASGSPANALLPDPAATDPSAAGPDDDGLRALRAVRSLPPEQRRMLEWSLADGLSHAEIADRTGTPLGTVKSAIRRGLLFVREALQRKGTT